MPNKSTTALDQKLYADLQLTDEVLGNDYAADGVTVIDTCRIPLGDLIRRGIVPLDAPVATLNSTNTVSVAGPILGYTEDSQLVVRFSTTAGTNGWVSITTALQPGDNVSALTNDAGFQDAADVAASITAAINNLLDGAPGALDTLNELSAALGDDPDFAATITAAVAAKENLQTPASQAEAEAGTEVAIRSWSPLRVKQAINAIGQAFADAAAASAAAAASSESAAGTSEFNADASASAASTSETNAGTSASAASTSETNAAASASAASTSASAASTSETNAATSESNAAQSESDSEAWANTDEDVLVPLANGGDEIDDYSALHWAKKSESARDEAVAATPSEIIDAVDTALAVRRVALRDGVYSDGTTEALSVPQQLVTDITLEDFSVFLPTIILTDYTPSARVILWTNEDGNTGVRIVLETTGALTIEFGDGTDWDASYTTTKLIDYVPAYSPITLAVVVDRSAEAQFYLDGVSFETVTVSGASAIDVDTTNAWEVLPSTKGWIYGLYARSSTLHTSLEVSQYHETPDLLQRGSSGVIYESDFTASVDGFSNVTTNNGPITFNETADGEAGWLKQVKSADTKESGFAKTVPKVVNRYYRVIFDCFTPVGSAINQLRVRWTTGWADGPFSIGTAGTRFRYDHTEIATVTSSSFQIQQGASSLAAWPYVAFSGDGVDDLFYIKNVQIIELGIVEVINLRPTGTTKPDLIGTNDATSGANTEDAL